ncbi:hypothetical protein B0H11DRAFT_1036035 [Mycena galericulata]|nr:hypothetical protein B0H11DRAFT_1036035 [Mycena galericulata]
MSVPRILRPDLMSARVCLTPFRSSTFRVPRHQLSSRLVHLDATNISDALDGTENITKSVGTASSASQLPLHGEDCAGCSPSQCRSSFEAINCSPLELAVGVNLVDLTGPVITTSESNATAPERCLPRGMYMSKTTFSIGPYPMRNLWFRR